MDILFTTVFVLAALAIVSTVNSMLERRAFRARMRQEGRYLEWTEIRNRLSHGEGALVVYESSHECEVWWVSDKSMLTLSPRDMSVVAFRTACPLGLDINRIKEDTRSEAVYSLTELLVRRDRAE